MQVNTLAIDIGEIRALTNARRELRGAVACKVKDLKLEKREQLFAEYRKGTSFTGVTDVTTGTPVPTREWRRVYARAVPTTVGATGLKWTLWRYWTGCRLEDTPCIRLLAKPVASGWELSLRFHGAARWKSSARLIIDLPAMEEEELMVLMYPRLLPLVLSLEGRYGSTDLQRGQPPKQWDRDLDWVIAQEEGTYVVPERRPTWFGVEE